MHSTLFRINGKFWGLSGEIELFQWWLWGMIIIRPDQESGYRFTKCNMKSGAGFLFAGTLQPQIVDASAKDEE